MAAALALGAQYRAQGVIKSPEAVSTVLFNNATRLASNRDLVAGGDLTRLHAREAFASDLREVVRLVGEAENLRE